ncbi:hypothetical protein [Nostoc sp. FACHB-110]|uniref:hypothetical protein n=1 Tax=Nostoc sp. FACHB-110 TaxID=2692834 RepID=UPI0016833619|nr:hypothetical protein [Nostoc sp. FACHB-110]MBD2437331.1 hypothetical protein [Nostoc sp. FACHB-110]
MPRKLTQIDTFAQKLIEELPPSQRYYPGENMYVGTATRLIQRKLKEYYQGTGAKEPQLSAIRSWFYSGCPEWAIAALYHATNQRIAA